MKTSIVDKNESPDSEIKNRAPHINKIVGPIINYKE